MKRIMALLLAGVLAFGAMACSSGGQSNEPAAEAPEAAEANDGEAASNGKRIFMSAAYYAVPYGAPLMSAVEKRCEELGYEIQIVDGEENADKQLTQFKTAVADGFDALIYWPGDSASTPPVVEYLNSTGLPWVDINTVPDDSILDQCTIIASDEVQIGRELGKLIVQYAEENQLENMNIVYIEGASGSSYTIHLTEGIEEILADYPNIKILNDHQYANFDPSTAMNIMDDMITKFGDDIDLVVAQDGGMFEGAYNAVAAAGKLGEYGLLCQGQDLIVREKLESGELFATVAQDPFQEGTLTVDVLDKLLKGEETDAWTYTPTGPIFAEDVEGYSWF